MNFKVHIQQLIVDEGELRKWKHKINVWGSIYTILTNLVWKKKHWDYKEFSSLTLSKSLFIIKEKWKLG